MEKLHDKIIRCAKINTIAVMLEQAGVNHMNMPFTMKQSTWLIYREKIAKKLLEKGLVLP